jgi:hypothetical protein
VDKRTRNDEYKIYKGLIMTEYPKIDFWKASDFEVGEEIEYRQSLSWHKAIIKDFDYYEYAGAKTLVLIVEKKVSEIENRTIRIPTVFRIVRKKDRKEEVDDSILDDRE